MWVRNVTNFEQWRETARPLLIAGIAPNAIDWGHTVTLREAAAGFAPPTAVSVDPSSSVVPHGRQPRISASLLRLLETLSLFRHPGRWELMYRLAWRSTTENSRLLEDAADPDVRHASLMERAVNRDVHKMHAFVRFREIQKDEKEKKEEKEEAAYFAWFEPEHEILRRAARHFSSSVFPTCDGRSRPPTAPRSGMETRCISPPTGENGFTVSADEYESLWRTYYRSICNVARINPAAMQREMPQRYWKHLPEAAEIGPLIRDGMANFVNHERESRKEGISMTKAVKRSLPAPVSGDTPQTCRRCELWKNATQAVEGEGEGGAGAGIMLVGEQPGDEEDLRGHPFVGPAGKVLDQAIAAAGLDRKTLFITNAVKHFKWEPRGKRRLHKKPGTGEINACNIWVGAGDRIGEACCNRCARSNRVEGAHGRHFVHR